jgi:mRNA interferase MazF
MPGNVLLTHSEANLSKDSVVNISQLVTVARRDLQEKIGSLSRKRVLQIIDGLNLLLEPMD